MPSRYNGGPERGPMTVFNLLDQGVGQFTLVETCIKTVLNWYPNTTRPKDEITREMVKALVLGDKPIERVGGVYLGIDVHQLQAGVWDSSQFDMRYGRGAGEIIVNWLIARAELYRDIKVGMAAENLEVMLHSAEVRMQQIMINTVERRDTQLLPDIGDVAISRLGINPSFPLSDRE